MSKYYKLIIFLSAPILFSFILVGCSDPVEPRYKVFSRPPFSLQTTTESNNLSIQPFDMEHIGESSSDGFDYYRDVVTDVVYIFYRDKVGYAGMGGLTLMLDPDTGFPLTYTRYMEMYNKIYAASADRCLKE